MERQTLTLDDLGLGDVEFVVDRINDETMAVLDHVRKPKRQAIKVLVELLSEWWINHADQLAPAKTRQELADDQGDETYHRRLEDGRPTRSR
jgi:hypothetical protein